MKTFLRPALISFTMMAAASFTSLGAFVAFLLALPFGIGGLEGLQVLWIIGIVAGVPFFGFAFALLFPGKEGRRSALLSLSGMWAGLFTGAVVATKLQGLS